MSSNPSPVRRPHGIECSQEALDKRLDLWFKRLVRERPGNLALFWLHSLDLHNFGDIIWNIHDDTIDDTAHSLNRYQDTAWSRIAMMAVYRGHYTLKKRSKDGQGGG